MRSWILAAVALLCASTLVPPAVAAKSDVQDRLNASAEVFNDIMKVPEKGIPEELLERAECVVVIPSMLKGGFIFGGNYGKGIATCRNGSRWSPPSMEMIAGGSFGLQIGGEGVDLIMLIMNKRGADMLYRDKITLGADVSAAAGPVGRHISAETNARLNSEILTWSRAKGLFGGITVKGATLRPDKKANEELFGRAVSAREILAGNVPMPAAARPVIADISRHWQAAVADVHHAPGTTAEPRGLAPPPKNDRERHDNDQAVPPDNSKHYEKHFLSSDENNQAYANQSEANMTAQNNPPAGYNENQPADQTRSANAPSGAEAERIQAAANVLQDISSSPEGIPGDLLNKAQCVAVVPSMVSGGFMVGGRYGQGVVSCRTPNGWSAPAFIRIAGGSYGLQIGGEKTDLVMLIMNQRGKDFLFRDKITLGADISAAAGPVGRAASAQTNVTAKSEILTYSRAKGAFAGVSLGGAKVSPDKKADKDFYGSSVTAQQILNGQVPPPPQAQPLLATLQSVTATPAVTR